MWPHDLKLRRARQHLKELEGLIARWEREAYVLQVEPTSEPDYALKALLDVDTEDDPEWPLLIGDFLQNAWAALDYMAFALGDAGAPSGFMGADAAADSMFSIIGDVDRQGFSGRGPDLFAQAAAKRLATVSETARAAIERVQPYFVGGMAWRSEPLWILNELARYDRHRFLQVAVVRTGDLTVDPATSRNVRISSFEVERGRFFPNWDESGQLIPTTIAHVKAYPANRDQPMELHFKDALYVGLHVDPLPATLEFVEEEPVGLTLRAIDRAVSQILSELARFLPAEPPHW